MILLLLRVVEHSILLILQFLAMVAPRSIELLSGSNAVISGNSTITSNVAVNNYRHYLSILGRLHWQATVISITIIS